MPRSRGTTCSFPRLRVKSLSRSLAKYGVLIVFALTSLFPFAWVFVSSLKTNVEIYEIPFAPPTRLRISNYVHAWQQIRLGVGLLNSVAISSFSVFLTVLISAMAAYVLARVVRSSMLFAYFGLGIMIPVQAVLIPSFMIVRSLGLMGTRLGLSLVYTAGHITIAIFILYAFYRSVPREFEEAATMDGCSRSQVFFSMILPLSRSALATVATVTYIWCWNDYLLASVFLSKLNLHTLTVFVFGLRAQYTVDYGLLCAGLVIAILPVSVVYILFQEQVIKALTAGAIKG